MFEVLSSAERVSMESRDVRIDMEALAGLSGEIAEMGTPVPEWDSLHHFFDGTERTVAYFMVLDTLNFCFWPAPGTERWEIDFESERISGYNALAAALKGAVESGIPITRADYLRDISMEGLREVLGGRGELQLMEERAAVLRELGRVLIEGYGGVFHGLVEAAGGSAVRLARLLTGTLSSFRDVARYGNVEVYFLKRAQILGADLHGAFNGRAWGEFLDLDQLTAFADYKVPQVLRHLGVLRYSESLAETVDRGIQLDAGGPLEVEIRANTVRAVDLLRQDLEGKGSTLAASQIDWILWNLGQEDRFRERPYHRTVSIFY